MTTSHALPVFTPGDIELLTGALYVKVLPTLLRPITEEDVKKEGSSFKSLEGTMEEVAVGRFYCLGVKGERWTTSAEHVVALREPVPGARPNADGYLPYRMKKLDPVVAYLVSHPFQLKTQDKLWTCDFQGGGYITWNTLAGTEMDMRIEERDIFENTYQEAELFDWHMYWKGKKQPWRRSAPPLLSRQLFLQERYAIVADRKTGMYPFQGITLTPEDVDYLLELHGPVTYEKERGLPPEERRDGLHLEGAILTRGDYRDKPFARVSFAPASYDEEPEGTEAQHAARAVFQPGSRFGGAKFDWCHMTRMDLGNLDFEHAHFRYTKLDGSDLRGCDFHGAQVLYAQVKGARMVTDGYFVRCRETDWTGTNLSSLADWREVTALADELGATTLEELRKAQNAYAHFLHTLDSQSLSVASISYRVCVIERKMLYVQKAKFHWALSKLQDLLVGYGYKWRNVLSTTIVYVCLFAVFYMWLGQTDVVTSMLESVTNVALNALPSFPPITPIVMIGLVEILIKLCCLFVGFQGIQAGRGSKEKK